MAGKFLSQIVRYQEMEIIHTTCAVAVDEALY